MSGTTYVYSKWDIARFAILPGATTTVEVDLSSITPRMRTNLIKKMDAFFAGKQERGYYSKSGELFRAVKRHCGIRDFCVSRWVIDIDDITPEIWDVAYGIAATDTAAVLMMDVNDRYKRNRKEAMAVLVSKCDDPKRSTFRFNLEFGDQCEKRLEELKAMVVAHYKKTEEEKFEKLQQLINYGGTFEIKLLRSQA
jgi:hypothetical protein